MYVFIMVYMGEILVGTCHFRGIPTTVLYDNSCITTHKDRVLHCSNLESTKPGSGTTKTIPRH